MQQICKLVFPATCVICKNSSQRDLDLCFNCEKTLPFLPFACHQCANPLPPSSVKKLICGACLKNPPSFDEIKSLFRYDDPIDNWIMQIKFHENLIYTRLLATLMLQYFASNHSSFDCIIPMPLHRSRLKQRGFNQALEIARPISKKLNIPLQFKYCHRIRHTFAQSQLSFQERFSNIKNAFSISENLNAKKVLVIDDVVTTGNTMQEFCKTLKKNGIEFITVWVCARAILK